MSDSKNNLPQLRASRLPVSEIVKDRAFKTPFAVGLVVVVAALFTGSPFAWVLAFAFFLIGVPGWIFYLKNRELLAASSAPAASDIETDQLKQIRRALAKSQFHENLDEAQVQRAQGQYDQAVKRYKGFRVLLDQKFDRGELTYDRYAGAAEQVFLGIMDNLQAIVNLFGNLSAIDSRHLLKRVQSLSRGNAEESRGDSGELAMVKGQLGLRDKMLSDLIDRMQSNEKALNELVKVSDALAAVDTGRGNAGVALDQSMRELEELAKRVNKYSKPN